MFSVVCFGLELDQAIFNNAMTDPKIKWAQYRIVALIKTIVSTKVIRLVSLSIMAVLRLKKPIGPCNK